MAAPAFGAKGTAAAATTNSVAPTLPGSISANDILFIVVVKWAPNTTGSDPTISTPSGWTLAADTGLVTASSPDDGWAALFWKRASGGESGTVTISTTGDTGNDTCLYAQCYRFSGCITSGDPWDAIATGSFDGSSADIFFNAVTVSGSERTLAGFLGRGGGNTSYTPSGYTSRAADNTTTGADAELEVWTLDNVSSDGATDLNQNASNSIPAVTFHVSLKPPATSTVTLDVAIAGSGTASGEVVRTRGIDTSVVGVGALAPDFVRQRAIEASVAGSGSLSSDFVRTLAIEASLAGLGELAADLALTRSLEASIAGEGALSAELQLVKLLEASIAGTGDVSATLEVLKLLEAAIAGTSSVSADLIRSATLAADLSGNGAVSAELIEQLLIAASSAGLGQVTGEIAETKTLELVAAGEAQTLPTLAVQSSGPQEPRRKKKTGYGL